MAVHRLPISLHLEVDTVAGTAVVVVTTPAANGEGDVVLYRIPLTTLTSDDRRRLRHLFAAAQT